MKLTCNLSKFIESNQISLLVFFGSLFVFIFFANTRLFLTDEAAILNQFYNLIHGSISLEVFKIKSTEGAYLFFGERLYGRFSYSLLFLSLPIYYILREIDLIYGAHLFILLIWSLSGGAIIYLMIKVLKLRYAEAACVMSFYILFATNIYFFKPIYFPRWGELISIEFANIIISSFLVLSIYLLFKKIFGSKLAIFASIFVVLATPISFYAVTLKHHSLSLLLTMMAFFFFYKYQEKKDNRFIYLAYASAALCIWTRTLDGVVLMTTLLFTDLIIFRYDSTDKFKHIFSVSMVIIIFMIPFFSFNYLILGSPISIMEKTKGGGKPVMVEMGQEPIIFDENPPNQKMANILLKNLGYVETTVNLGIIIRQGSGTVEVFRNDSGNLISLGNTTTSKTYTVIRGTQLEIVATPSIGYNFERYVNNKGNKKMTNPMTVYQNWNGGLDTYFNSTRTNMRSNIRDYGTVKNGDSWKNTWQDIVIRTTFLKFGNTFGIFLVSPFLIVAIVFILEILKQKVKINMFDKFLGLYTISLFYSYKDFLFPAIIDSPMLLENRYLLITYVVLLYFVFRIDMVRNLIESKLKTIFILYCIFLIVILSYFIEEFPIPFISLYYIVALITSFSLLTLLTIGILAKKRIVTVDNLTILSIAISLALASSFLIVYYWIVNTTYISPSQNYMIIPIFDNILRSIYQMVII